MHKHRRSARKFRQDLRAIYTGKDGKLPDLTQLTHNSKSKLTSFLIKIIGIFFVLSLLAWGGFFLFTRGLMTGNETLAVSIETEDEIRAGEETTLKVHYENTGDVPIAALEMKLNLPASFHPTSLVPEPNEKLNWMIGALTPHSDGTIVVKGLFLSEIPSTQRIQALFSYKPANFSSNFQEIESKTIDMKTSTIEMTLSGPQQVLAGDAVEYVIKLKQTGKDPVFNLRVQPILPTDFVINAATPEINAEQAYWEIPTLEPGKLQEIKMTGTFTSTASGTLPVGARVGFVDEEQFFEQAKTHVNTEVLGGAVTFHLIVDGSDQGQTVSPGKILHGSMDYKNPGSEAVGEVSFVLQVTATGTVPIAWKDADLSDGQRAGNVITWNETTVPSLAVIEAGKEGVIDFTLPLLQTLTATDADSLTISLAMTVNHVGSIESTRTIEATPIQISIASNVSLQAYGQYFTEDGTQVGSGELPPQVGKTTSYRIMWDLTNSMHDLGNVEISTILPQNITWKDSVSKDIGTLVYNSTTRQVRWQISKLPKDIKQAQAWFDVAITPNASDVGSVIKLTNQSTLEAVDLTTQTQTNTSFPAITTDLPQDEFANGKGMVIQ